MNFWTKAAVLVATIIVLHGCSAPEETELDRKVEAMAAEQGITDKEEIKEFKRTVRSIVETKEHLDYMAIQDPCKSDIKRFCAGGASTSDTLQCMKNNREQVTVICEDALRTQFGGNPISKAQLYRGVEIPVGSTFFYNGQGEIVSVVASESFVYDGIHFRKGRVWFNEEGLHTARLTTDQVINGIKYKAEGIGPFFDESGNVENASLAEDTEIGGVLYQGGTQMRFYAPGKVQSGKIARDVTIRGQELKAGDSVWFNKDGSVKTIH